MRRVVTVLLSVGWMLSSVHAVDPATVGIFVDDPFDDGDITTNVNGKGSGHLLMTALGEEKSVREMAGGPAIWGTDGGDWMGYELHSLDEIEFLAEAGFTRFSWTVGNVDIETDNPGGFDSRLYVGVMPVGLAEQRVDTADLWLNTSGGVFLLMEFDSATPGIVELRLFGVNHGKAPETFPDASGSATLVWDWDKELVEISLDLDERDVIVRRDGEAVIQQTWWGMGMVPGGTHGVFAAGAWGFHYGSNYATGRGGHELHGFRVESLLFEGSCNDGIDEDGDTLVDCEDPDCTGDVACPVGVSFVRGDSDSNGSVELTDGLVTLVALYQGGLPPMCMDAADADDSGVLELTDAVLTFQYLYSGGEPPAPPAPSVSNLYPPSDCGVDTTPDDPLPPTNGELGCEQNSSTCPG